MLRTAITTLCISMCVFLVSCNTGWFTPIITPFSTPQKYPPVEMKTEAALSPPTSTTTIISTPPIACNPAEILDEAITNLLNATSFEMAAHEIIAYQILRANGESSQVYGEFTTNYAVIRLLHLKVFSHHEYRYDPQVDFASYDSFTYQENDKYFTKFIETSGNSTVAEIDLPSIEPFAGDVYQTLVNYSDQARLVSESDAVAVYVLNHPYWYTLEGAIGFADLGFLHGQENGEYLVEQYVAENYPNVETITFTIYVALDEIVITRVEVDNKDFMVSLWAEVDRTLIEQGIATEALTRYVIMAEHRSNYLFSNYNQVQEFDFK